MKKELKDYLHLYLGCDVYMDNPHAAFHKDILDVDLLERLYNDLPMKCYKLILRPLSDMTGEEAAKFIEIGTSVYDFIGIRKVDRYEVMFDVGYATSTRTWLKHLRFNELKAEQFTFLLSKHFDLFGLIESGLAVNAAEIKSVSIR